MNLSLDTPVQYVQRVGPTMAARLEKLGIFTVKDLLFYPPFRYNDFSHTKSLASLKAEEVVTVAVTLMSIRNVITKHGKSLQQAVVADNSGTLTVNWYNQPFLTKIMKAGDQLYLSGKVNWFGHQLTIVSPEYEIASADGTSLHTGRFVPVYSETAGLTSKWLRGRVAAVLPLANQVVELIPDNIRAKNQLWPIAQAIAAIHFPKTLEEGIAARRRLAFEELLLLNLRAKFERSEWEKTQHAPILKVTDSVFAAFLSALPFTLTIDQATAVGEIRQDLTRSIPANRLLEGDVGAGKTVVAATAMLIAHQTGYQSIVMAPTEILARQHFQTLEQFLSPHGLTVALVTGAKKTPNHKTAQVLVGTHALLSRGIKFGKVGLIVIDEQQRFGVNQRMILREKQTGSHTPHLLTMTATPIPRTIARTIYGNLDLSVIETMPTGRKPVKTWVVPSEKRDGAYDWMKKTIKETGGQAFIVCPIIEESENLADVKAVTVEYERLKTSVFTNLNLGLLHGRMKPKEKELILSQFREHKFDVLVSTPVVEVGIDIPNANIMLIEAAERFGLSQLHQLRGRVGRSDAQAYCLLFTELTEERVVTRLKSLETTHSGPKLAEIDLALRGPGDLFGTRQHGIPGLKYSSLADTELISRVQQSVTTLYEAGPSLNSFPLLRDELKKGTIHVSQD